jgi:hypothetical protein
MCLRLPHRLRLRMPSDALIELMIRSQVGSGASITKLRDHPLARSGVLADAINSVLTEAQQLLAKPIACYVVDSLEPEHFCLVNDELVIAVVSPAFVGFATATNMAISSDGKEGASLQGSIIQVCLNIMARYLLYGNHDGLAVDAFIRSLVGTKATLIMIAHGKELDGLEGATLEHFIVVWCLGLAHEIGHSWPHRDAKWIVRDDELRQLIAEVHSQEDIDYLGDIAQLLNVTPSMGREHISDELKADCFAATVVVKAAQRWIRKREQREADADLLAMEIMQNMFHVQLTDRCRRAVRYATTRDETDARVMLVASVAFVRRMRTTWDVLADLGLPQWEGYKVGIPEGIARLSVGVNEGFWDAVDVIAHPQESLRALTKIGGLRPLPFGEEFQNYFTLFSLGIFSSEGDPRTGKTMYQLMAQRFLEPAIAVKPTSRELRVLAKVTENPSLRVRNFIAPLTISGRNPDRFGPLRTAADHVAVILVFTTRTGEYERLIAHRGRETLFEVRIESVEGYEHEMITPLKELLKSREEVMLVFQGTAAFQVNMDILVGGMA